MRWSTNDKWCGIRYNQDTVRSFFFALSFSLVLVAEPLSSGRVPELVIMMDVDETLLSEADHAAFAKNERASVVRYTPSDGLNVRSLLHSVDLADGRRESVVAVRPGMVSFFEKMAPLIASGKARIVLTSLNDDARTKAVQEQIQVGGKTLKERGVEVTARTDFAPQKGEKNFALLRNSLRLRNETRVVAIDENERAFAHQGSNDFIVLVPAFGPAAADQYLEGHDYANKKQIEAAFEGIFDEVTNKRPSRLTPAMVNCFRPLAQ